MKTSITPAGKQKDILPLGICFSHLKSAACNTALGPVVAVTMISTRLRNVPNHVRSIAEPEILLTRSAWFTSR
jgi:hypothetical protein